MDFASMIFPLTVDVSGTQYWIGDEGPYKLGMATTEFMVSDGDAWKIYKCAYKKYYARLMEGAMTQEEFKVWADEAAAERDEALRQLQR